MDTHRSSRRSFLGQLGVTAAAGLGLALIPSGAQAQDARPAHAGSGKVGSNAVAYRCCVSTCRSCGPEQVAYKCNRVSSSCSPANYCTSCGTSRGTCYDQFGC